jgi:hypothetical protein
MPDSNPTGSGGEEVHATPLLWLALCCEEWGTPRGLAQDTWRSVTASREEKPCAFRQWVLVQPYVDVGHFLKQHPPQAVVEVLEVLVTERRLARRQASALEEYLLATVTATGAWQGEKERKNNTLEDFGCHR